MPFFLPAATGVICFILTIQLTFGGMEGMLLSFLVRVLPLMAFLCVAVAAWALLAARFALDPATGVGFAVASLGLLLRVLVPLASVLDLLVRHEGATPPSVNSHMPAADVLGTFAYAFGLGMVVLATCQEARKG